MIGGNELMRKPVTFVAAAAIASLLVIVSGCGGSDERTGPPDVVMVIVDAVRTDHLSLNGYHRPTTPVMDSLAGEGSVWGRMQAQSCWNMPGVASVLTGLPQRSIAVGYSEDRLYGIDQSLMTIPNILKRSARYQTAGFFNSGVFGEEYGFHIGFDHFDSRGVLGKDQLRDAGQTVSDFLEWYESARDDERPLFAVIHFQDLHLPYSPPAGYDELYADPKFDPLFNCRWGRRSQVDDVNSGRVAPTAEQLGILIGLYDGELEYVDSCIGTLVRALRERNAAENTVFLVVGSHGEEFMDHGCLGHGHTLFQELLSVPLVMCGPGIPSEVQWQVAAHMDLLPTVLGLAGLEEPMWAEGRDLLSDSSSSDSRYVPAGGLLWSDRDLLALRYEERVIIGNPVTMEASLYDLETDPTETSPITPSRDSRDQLYYHWSIPPRGDPLPAGPEGGSPGMLRDLGYIN
ncbi:MAG: hypothetical protein AVO35_04750 [Candidatus Aegiribacteria sp. MLS_C]|nr:MAG: hypothetical protein AVO35_04750 [Candidatus Aegiribacteria sp. MLS_C]